ncbi:ABC transporter substrate-binding protein [Streptomyces benahoarensis]|uniref:ABC transporter substrate-binding protein n=1 Tax=Streptomyces benahoarensis TaxID=2595054 RepID=A0A553ZNK8_9ACTN|nr:ABC transporter substrate-binding protein [Streptomyces benahoarensis]TSB25989.1 ABC transporter substrate-binding protein [Streptomyces benahoarensis]TSB43051.1 ABC transporter substrate-binding protein [Streptomyces benahoarensis]
MRRSVPVAAIAAITSAGLLAGCTGGAGSTASGKANAATEGIVNASDAKGGTVTYAMSDAPESFDPGNTYYAFVYNFSRLYARSLTTFKPGPGPKGNEIVPDLAESKGKSSDGGKTWTYKLRKGVKYDDGTDVTSQDVKYAVERSNFARDTLSLGPNYFQQFLKDNDGGGYKGPYKDKSKAGLKSIETPDDHTIVFHLKKALAEFDQLVSAPQTAPVPQAKDKGADYTRSVVSSGSYKFQDYQEGKQLTLVRNPHWSAKTDPLRKQLPDKIVLKLKVAQSTIDKDLLAGNTTVDLAGKGVDAQTQAQLLTDAKEKGNTDNALGQRLNYLSIDTKVKPFDKLACRQAVEYAVDKKAVQTSLGGPIRGDIASTVLPTDIPGYEKFDLYPQKYSGDNLDLTEAKKKWTECGAGNVSTTILARSDRQEEVDAATSVISSLKKLGITAKIQQYPSSKYFSDYAGVPTFNKKNNVGLIMMQWGADFPTGYGYLQQILNGKAISSSGNVNLSETDDPEINKLLDSAVADPDKAGREKAYAEIDKKAMSQALMVPLTYFKVLNYRSPKATNMVATSAYSGQYDYLNIGVKK